MHIYIYIYIYLNREREREREILGSFLVVVGGVLLERVVVV